MANYPTVLDSLTNPTANQKMNAPSHSTIETAQNTAITALETKVGVDSSAVTTSLDYLVKNTSSVDPGHKHSTSSLSATGTPSSTTFLRGDNVWGTLIPQFGGTGADGALTLVAGTTTISLAGARVVIKNYTSISITGSASVAFTNPHANGTYVIFKSQGNVTITTNTVPAIDLRGIGAAGDTAGTCLFGTVGAGGDGAAAATAGTAGAALSPVMFTANLVPKFIPFVVGSGGGAGGANGSGVAGTAARGGGAFYMECAGAYNVTGTINTSGNAGGNASGGGTTNNAGGGGGGGGGSQVILYSSLTANTGTYTVAGGAGGTKSNGATSNGAGGGGGGGSNSAGTVGGTGTTNNTGVAGDGGAGGNAFSLVQANTEFT